MPRAWQHVTSTRAEALLIQGRCGWITWGWPDFCYDLAQLSFLSFAQQHRKLCQSFAKVPNRGVAWIQDILVVCARCMSTVFILINKGVLFISTYRDDIGYWQSLFAGCSIWYHFQSFEMGSYWIQYSIWRSKRVWGAAPINSLLASLFSIISVNFLHVCVVSDVCNTIYWERQNIFCTENASKLTAIRTPRKFA